MSQKIIHEDHYGVIVGTDNTIEAWTGKRYTNPKFLGPRFKGYALDYCLLKTIKNPKTEEYIYLFNSKHFNSERLQAHQEIVRQKFESILNDPDYEVLCIEAGNGLQYLGKARAYHERRAYRYWGEWKTQAQEQIKLIDYVISLTGEKLVQHYRPEEYDDEPPY